VSHGARLILERIGVWDALADAPGALTPIVGIDISQAGGFGQMRLAATSTAFRRWATSSVITRCKRARCRARAKRRDACGMASRSRACGARRVCAIELRDGASAPWRDGRSTAPIEARLAAVADGTGAR
jgi:2-polyprenyl-6-methoxyphenol hydroxylase-like FAD-dependent oxidoreductase